MQEFTFFVGVYFLCFFWNKWKMVSDTVIFYMTCRQFHSSFTARRCSVKCTFSVSVSVVSSLWSSIWLISAWTIQTETETIQQSGKSELFILNNFNLKCLKGLWKVTGKSKLTVCRLKFTTQHLNHQRAIFVTHWCTQTHTKKFENCCSHWQVLFFVIRSSA